jgi:hypothetical protein
MRLLDGWCPRPRDLTDNGRAIYVELGGTPDDFDE